MRARGSTPRQRRRAAVWALAEATCRSSELPCVTATDEAHLADHATQHGGTFDTSGYLYGIDSILETFTTLITAYTTELDQPDLGDGDDQW